MNTNMLESAWLEATGLPLLTCKPSTCSASGVLNSDTVAETPSAVAADSMADLDAARTESMLLLIDS